MSCSITPPPDLTPCSAINIYRIVPLTLKEKRKHIKPFLLFSKKYYQGKLKIKNELVVLNTTSGLCNLARLYVFTSDLRNLDMVNRSEIRQYIQERLMYARPKDVEDCSIYWYDMSYEGIRKRIKWINWQLRNLKK